MIFEIKHLLLPGIELSLDQIKNWKTKNKIHFESFSSLIFFARLEGFYTGSDVLLTVISCIMDKSGSSTGF